MWQHIGTKDDLALLKKDALVVRYSGEGIPPVQFEMADRTITGFFVETNRDTLIYIRLLGSKELESVGLTIGPLSKRSDSFISEKVWWVWIQEKNQ